MKILVVDDRHEKVEKIAFAIRRSSPEATMFQETSAAAARRRLREERFDLLVIDINLPDAAGVAPSANGGIQFFDLVTRDPKARLPAEIIFVTSEDGLVEKARVEVERRGRALCVVSTSEEWMAVIADQVGVASRRKFRSIPEFDAAIISALRAPELEAVLALDYNWKNFIVDEDPTTYYSGVMKIGETTRTVVAASPVRKGMAASAALATKLVLKFQPKILIMTGICAGIKDRTNLGDVVVGDPTWDWGSGKHAESSDGSLVFKLSPKQREINMRFASLSDQIDQSAEFKSRVRGNWTGRMPEGQFKCHVGPMASGASVIAHDAVASTIAEQNRDLIAVDMEAFAVMVACEYATSRPLFGLAIKSVCDFADKEKRDDWQAYASYTSAAFTDELLRRHFSEI